MIAFINRNKGDGKSFFAYLSYTAAHDPLHAPKEYIDKYKGKFAMGWDSLALLRIENLKALGIVPADVKMMSNPITLPCSRNPSLMLWRASQTS